MFRAIPLPSAVGLGALLIVSIFSVRLLLRSRRKRKITRIIETLFGRKLSKPPAVGLDIGTSFCRVAVYQDGKVQVVSDTQGNRAIPSCVSFGAKEIITGTQAVIGLSNNVANTVYDAKLLMGRRYEDPVVKNSRKYLTYNVINDDGKAKIQVQFRGKSTIYNPEEIITFQLKKLKDMAENQVGERLEDAVITVPAFFTDSQRQATIEAGVNAGFRVLRLVNEPAAAAVAFGYTKRFGRSEVNILVVHIGAGTSDASLVYIHDGTFTVKATAGDANLGGKDFDERMMTYFQKEFKLKFHKELEGNTEALLRLRHACERAKIQLGNSSIANIELDALLPELDFYATISKNDFEDLCCDLFDKFIAPVAKVLKDAKLPKSQVDHVVLVGACTNVPKIQQILNVFFEGREPDRVLDPEEAAVMGAALQAAVLAGHNVDKLPDLALLDVNPLSLGIETVGGIMTILIPRNSVLPARETQIFTTYLDNQSSVLVQVYEGERGVTKDNNFLGKFKLSGIPPMPRGVPQVCVTFTIDVNGILTVTACEKNTGKENKITITRNQVNLNKDVIQRKVQEAAKHKEEDDQVCQRVSAKISYENYVFKVKSTMEDLESSVKDRVSEEDRNSVLNKCYEAMQWLTSNPTANKEELLARLAEMEIACSPVIAKLYALKGVIFSETSANAACGINKSSVLESLDIEELQRATVKMKDPNLIEEKICKLIKGGQAKLQVISDFDMTLSRFHLHGKRCSSCHGAIETNPRMPASYRKKAKAFVEKYYPIEVDPNLSNEQKVPLMVEWWSFAHQALCETKLKESDLKAMVQESAVVLRDGCQTFLQTLHEHGVLLIIFSAGLGNVLEEVIQQQACMFENIHIISNYMNFDNDGQLTGFSNELIHSCNKNSTSLSKLDCYSECLERPCILLLGDSLGDVNMDTGLPTAEVTLKIGFLNDHVDASLQKYLEIYDIVLVNDQTMDVVNAVLRKIL